MRKKSFKVLIILTILLAIIMGIFAAEYRIIIKIIAPLTIFLGLLFLLYGVSVWLYGFIKKNALKRGVGKNSILFGFFSLLIAVMILAINGWYESTYCANNQLFPEWAPWAFCEFMVMPEKPVIYLYPETVTDVTVQLDYQGTLIADYPRYSPLLGGWKVTAYPDSTLINHSDGKEYSYLFWEGKSSVPIDWDLTTGFVVPGSDTKDFLQTTLADIGLTPKEYNEFIVYWFPKMQNNAYNLIHFAGEQYTDTAPLTISPEPDSVLRVFMVYKPLTEKISITPQLFPTFIRNGFTVVEWGGAEL